MKLERRQFLVSNPACIGKTLAELQLRRISEVNITRIARGHQVLLARNDSPLAFEDVVVAVGRPDELEKLKLVFGEEMEDEEVFNTTDVMSRDAIVSNDSMVGRKLAELQLAQTHGVVLSRVFREDLDFVPTGTYALELGDVVRVVGSREDCMRFVETVGQQEKRIHETSIAALSLGIFLSAAGLQRVPSSGRHYFPARTGGGSTDGQPGAGPLRPNRTTEHSNAPRR